MKTRIARFAALVSVLGCLAGLGAQQPLLLDGTSSARGKAVQVPFELKYPPESTYAVVVRQDLPTVPAKGAREPDFPVEIGDAGWKGPGSMFRAKPVGTLAFGEVMKVERVDYSRDHLDLRLVSVDPHEIVVDASRPERNKHAQVATQLTVPHDAGIEQILERVDAYVRLFPSLDAARAYARSLREPQPNRRFTLAVVRRDGILVPIANYDNGHWFRRWPLPASDLDVPFSLDAVPPDWWGLEGRTSTWTLWTLDGQSLPIHATSPLAFGAHCLMNVGLETDYRSLLPRPPLDQHHYPKDGIATTGSPVVAGVKVATADDPSWSSFERSVGPYVARMEALSRLPAAVLAQRGTTPVKLEVLCLANGAAEGTYNAYFEAARRYLPVDATEPRRFDADGRPILDANKGTEEPCGPVTFAQGWVHATATSSMLDRTTGAQVTDCSMWNVEFGSPLGVVHVDGETIWVMEMARWGAERYDLVRVTDKTASVVLSIPGGSCKSLR